MSETRYHAYMIYAPAASVAAVNAALEVCYWGTDNLSVPLAALGEAGEDPAWDATPVGYMSHSTNLPLAAIRLVEDMTMGILPTVSFDPGIPEITMSVEWGGMEAVAIAALATVTDSRVGYEDMAEYDVASASDAFLRGLGLGKIPPAPIGD